MFKKLTAVALLATLLFACKKKTDTTTDPDAGFNRVGETLAQYDNTNFGVYVGTVVGSSGTIVFRIKNGDAELKGYLNITNDDGSKLKDTLTSTATVTLNQPIINVLFTGRTTSLRLSANADGSNATVSSMQVPGHPDIKTFLVHETSAGHIRTWEGKSTGTPTNTVTLLTIESNVPIYAFSRFSNDTTTYRGNSSVTLSSIAPGTTVVTMKPFFGSSYFLEIANNSSIYPYLTPSSFDLRWSYSSSLSAAIGFQVNRTY